MDRKDDAYSAGREDARGGKGGNPWAGTSDRDRHESYEDGQHDVNQEQAEKDADD